MEDMPDVSDADGGGSGGLREEEEAEAAAESEFFLGRPGVGLVGGDGIFMVTLLLLSSGLDFRFRPNVAGIAAAAVEGAATPVGGILAKGAVGADEDEAGKLTVTAPPLPPPPTAFAAAAMVCISGLTLAPPPSAAFVVATAGDAE